MLIVTYTTQTFLRILTLSHSGTYHTYAQLDMQGVIATKENLVKQTKLTNTLNIIQSTLVISNSKGLYETVRDIRTSTYQICRLRQTINRTTTFNRMNM